MDTILRSQGLSKRYGKKQALNPLDLELRPGRIVGLLGPNGSGKTTFLKLCAGLLTPTAGSIAICGENVGVNTKALVSYLPTEPTCATARKSPSSWTSSRIFTLISTGNGQNRCSGLWMFP